MSPIVSSIGAVQWFATSMAFNFVGDGAAAIAQGGNAGGAIAFQIVGHAAVGSASVAGNAGRWYWS